MEYSSEPRATVSWPNETTIPASLSLRGILALQVSWHQSENPTVRSKLCWVWRSRRLT